MLRHVPIALTLSRAVAGPVVAWLVLTGRPELAFSAFQLAVLTDLVDGRLAEAWGSNRALGRVLDPACDKILGSATWAALGLAGRAAPWMAGAFLLRDVAVAIGWLVLARRGLTLSSSRIGQLATTWEAVALALLLVPRPWFDVHWPSVGTWIGLAAWVATAAGVAGYLRNPRAHVGPADPAPGTE